MSSKENVAITSPVWLRGIVLLSLLLILSVPAATHAQEEENEMLDIVLLLDTSGSMLVTDPLDLRKEGSRLFATLLTEKDRLALVSFDRAPVDKLPLAPVNREAFEGMLQGIESLGQYTDLGLALEKAVTLLEKEARPEASKIVVLLSDGRFDAHPDRGTSSTLALSLVEGFLPSVLSKGIRVHTLSFSPQADRKFLEKIALKTGGFYWHTPTAEKIHESFVELLLAAKRPQLIGVGQKGVFIDELVEEATFYATRRPGERVTIVDPMGTPYSSVVTEPGLRWYSGQKFDVVTIYEPEAGTWTIKGANLDEGFATVLTKLKLKAEWPSYVVAGDPTLLEVQLYDGDKPLSLVSMNSLVDYEFQISSTDIISEPRINQRLRDDGLKGDRRKDDGVFSALIALEPGGYQLRVSAKSPTFERERILPFQVKPSAVTLNVVDNATGKGSVFVVNFDSQGEQLKGVEIGLQAVKDGKKWELPLEKRSEGKYVAVDGLLSEGGTYVLRAYATMVKKSGEVLKARSRPVRFRKVVEVRVEIPTEVPEVQEEDPVEEPVSSEQPSAIPYMLGAGVLNLISGVGAFFLLKKKFTLPASEDDVPPMPENISEIVASIEDRASLSEVDFADPFYRVQSESAAVAAPAALATPDVSKEGSTEEQSGGGEPDSEEADTGEEAEDKET